MILGSRGPLLLLVHLLLLELDLLLKPHLMRLRCPRYPALAGLLEALRLHLGLCLRLTALLVLFGLLGKVVNLPITLDIEHLLLLVNEDSVWVGEHLPLARPGRGSQFALLARSLRSDHPACVRSAGLLRHHLLLDGSCV